MQDAYKSPNGFYSVDHLSSVAFAVNNNLEKELGLEINGYEDLLDPALKGKIVMADPTSSSSAWNNISNIMAVYGNDTPRRGPSSRASSRTTSSSQGPPRPPSAASRTASTSSASPMRTASPRSSSPEPRTSGCSTRGGNQRLRLRHRRHQEGPEPRAGQAGHQLHHEPEGQVAFGEAVGTVRMTTTAEVNSEFLPKHSDLKWVERDVTWLTENRDAVVEKWTDLFTEVNG
ncbi:type 2 periplasmic-binding domain-containing protein [Tessaracoccus coleopterorum]|uniref:hypothetical protein n=1 Tax=Tessaracoccus coleopterorum TaxID=2714950 RepID=UPI001E61ECBB|nr:hypothetical protein [Tessaracoccus coleopterorum]